MLKQIITFLLLEVFLLHTFNKAIIVLDYDINREAYAASCENKAKPMLHCNGKCQMMKKLTQDDKNDSQSPFQKISSNEITLSSKSYFASAPVSFNDIFTVYGSSYLRLEAKMPREIFHPPGIIKIIRPRFV